MVRQARAAQTRQNIVDAGVRLFSSVGYLETDVKAIARAADLTPGAFYYHFPSKEALAMEIIAEGWSRIWALLMARLYAAEPGLVNVIATTMAQTELFAHDELVRLAVQLNLAYGHLSSLGRRDLQKQFDMFVDAVAANILVSDIRPDIPPSDVGELIWTMLLGSCLRPNPVDAPLDLVHDTKAVAMKKWRFLLQAVVPLESLPRFEAALVDSAARWDSRQAEAGS